MAHSNEKVSLCRRTPVRLRAARRPPRPLLRLSITQHNTTYQSAQARRRDPRLYDYLPDLCQVRARKLDCAYEDACPYAHNVYGEGAHCIVCIICGVCGVYVWIC